MTQDRRPRSEQHIAMEAPARAGPETQALPDAVEAVIAPRRYRTRTVHLSADAAAGSIGDSAGEKNPHAAYLWNGGPRRAGRTTADRRRSGPPEGRRAGARHQIRKRSRGGRVISKGQIMEPVPILTVGDLKSELSRWSDETPVMFRSPLKEQEFRFYRYRPG